MNRHTLIDAIPATLSLAAALLDATLTWSGLVHPSTPTAVLYFALALALGRTLSVWLHTQLIQQSIPPPAPAIPIPPPTGIAG